MACPWLIKKFVDREAEFLFVPADHVLEIAEQEGAIPYDVKGVESGHHGKACSFEAILKKYELKANDAILAEEKHMPMYVCIDRDFFFVGGFFY